MTTVSPLVRRTRTHVLLAIVVGLFVLQTGWHITTRVVQDEPWVSVPAYTLLTTGRMTFEPVFSDSEPTVWPPLLQLLLAGVFKLAGVGVAQGRWLTVFFGVLSVVLTFQTARLLYKSELVALWASIFLSVENMFFLASRTIRAEIVVTFFTLLGLFFFLVAGRENRAVWHLLAGLSVAFGMSTHPHGFLGTVAIAVSYVKYYRAGQQKGVFLYLAGVIAGSLPYLLFLLITDAASGFAAFRHQVTAFAPSAAGDPWLLTSVRNEIAIRYTRYLFSPYRVPIAIASLAVFVAGFVTKKREDSALSLIVGVHLVLFVLLLTKQKSVRYFALVSPYVGLLTASMLTSLLSSMHVKQGYRKLLKLALIVAIVGVLGVGQLIGNIFYHYTYRHTKYREVSDQLREIISPGASVFSIVTFWFALHDHPFYSYNRVSLEDALNKYQVQVFILDDSFMVNGVFGDEQYNGLRSELGAFLAQHGALIGEVDNWFYGDMKIYSVQY